MSAVNTSTDSSAKSASKKKKKSKKKANGPLNSGHASTETNGAKEDQVDGDDDEEDQSRPHSPNKASQPPQSPADMPSTTPSATDRNELEAPVRNGAQQHVQTGDAREDADEGDEDEEEPQSARKSSPTDTTARLDAMQQERDTLRAEVTQLRKSLESLQEKHSEELNSVKEELEQSEQGKEHAESQYKNLLGKVTTIRSQLGERLKADAAELETAREKIEELETSRRTAQEENERLQEQVTTLTSEMESQASEVETLRSRTNLSTSNWAKERDDMISREAYIREEYEVAKQAMQDWEILATEERSRREALEEKTQELEDQLNTQREAYERVKNEAETQSSTVDGLQRALRDLQDERKRELREMVEQNQAQLDALKAQTKTAEDSAEALKKELEETKKELDRTTPFEKEVKEKNLLIGKLRHEAVILNDHLTKALRFLKRGKPEDNVDRQLVTNHFLHFLQLDRSDPKKFQILQLIAALLGWDETQREQAGLLRQGTGFGTAGGSLRVPMSPFRRTPSTPTLGDFTPESPIGGRERESLAELWSDFLEREAEQGGSHSRRPSLASNKSGFSSMRSPSIMSPTSETGGRGPFGKGPASPDLKRKESVSAGGAPPKGVEAVGKAESPGPGPAK